jgi:hypothetical protein
MRRSVVSMAAGTLMTTMVGRAKAAKDYDRGVTDTEIKLGTTACCGGPASTAAAYGLECGRLFPQMGWFPSHAIVEIAGYGGFTTKLALFWLFAFEGET